MKKIIIILLLAVLLPFKPVFASDSNSDRWSGQDKVRHVGVACVSDIAAYSFFRNIPHLSKGKSRWLAFFSVMAAGLIKESLIDDRFSGKDLTADAVGAGLGAAFSISF
jgi:hypothetical protein